MIRGDSSEYNLLSKWAREFIKLDQDKYILSCEIGVREGLGSKIIMDELKPDRHIGVDPYGNLKYQHYDNSPAYTCDYTESMRLQLLKDMSGYHKFDLYHMTDIEFMNKNWDFGPFHFVHFDGPHMTKDVLTEAVWFADRSTLRTHFVFDDYPKYDMDLISKVLSYYGFELLEKGENKICLVKVKQK
jgi:hypothetical protein